MVEEGEGGYEIMPYKEIVALKKQIEELRLRTGDTDSKQLLLSMANLTKSMNNMLQLFKTAAEEMKLEQREEEAVAKKVGPLVDKVNELMEQNKTIAEGMVAIADMVKEMKEGKKSFSEKPEIKFNEPSFEEPELSFKPSSMPPPIQPVRFVPPRRPQGGGMPPPAMPPGGPIQPPGMPFDMGPEPFPPFEEPFPPLGPEKKKGFLGMFKKK